MFPRVRSTPLFAPDRARVIEMWRETARFIATRRHNSQEPEPENRAFGFASYVAALGAEPAAASGTAELASSAAA
jgi:hypothetical protein